MAHLVTAPWAVINNFHFVHGFSTVANDIQIYSEEKQRRNNGPLGEEQSNQYQSVKWFSEDNSHFEEAQEVKGRQVKWKATFLSYLGEKCHCTVK